MEARLLFLTPGDGLLTHFKEVDKRWVGLHQLFRLGDSEGRGVRRSRKWIHEAPDIFGPSFILKNFYCSPKEN